MGSWIERSDFDKIYGIPVQRVEVHAFEEAPGPFCMSFGFDLEALLRSIEKVGMINPPLVIDDPQGGCLRVVCGYRRIEAAKRLKQTKIPCRVASESHLSPLQCLLLNLYDNLATRPFNLVEKAMVLDRLTAYLSPRKIVDTGMPLLDLPAHEPLFRALLNLEHDLEADIKLAVAKGLIAWQPATMLLDMEQEPRRQVFDLLSNIKFNMNQQIQIIEYLKDISQTEKKSIDAVIKESEIMKIRFDGRHNGPQKAHAILQSLRTRRSPSQTAFEKVFKMRVARLNLPKSIRVSHPPFFESQAYRMEIIFRDGKELKDMIDRLHHAEGLQDLGDPWEERK